MKILFITPRYFPEIGGVERHTYKVAQELINAGNQICVITSTQKSKLLPYKLHKEMQIYRLLLIDRKNQRVNVFLNLIKMWFFLLINFRKFI